jgi:MoaE-MoaD fusion protein
VSTPLRTPATDPTVRVLLFGSLRERLGAELHVTAPGRTVADVWAALGAESGGSLPSLDGLRCARNLEFVPWDAAVNPGDELAFIPPVCGGSVDGARIEVRLTDAPIDVGALLGSAGVDADGAVACFVGRVRDHNAGATVHRLDYEAYEPMALSMMQAIATDAAVVHGLSTITAIHRLGTLTVSEVAVVVITSSPHRDQALLACSQVIEALKADVPIWKREHTASGARWVDARCVEAEHA